MQIDCYDVCNQRDGKTVYVVVKRSDQARNNSVITPLNSLGGSTLQWGAEYGTFCCYTIYRYCKGIAIEGVGYVLAGVFGSGTGMTSHSQNIGIIAVSKVSHQAYLPIVCW